MKTKFIVKEDFNRINFETLFELLNPQNNNICAYIIRDYFNKEECLSLKNEFFKIIKQTNGGNRSNDFVPVYQVGSTQFKKSTLDYFDECKNTKQMIDELIESVSADVKEDFLLEKSLKYEFGKMNISFSPSSYNSAYVNQFTIRQWTNCNDIGFALLPHEDLSQLNMAKLDDYEIGNVNKVIACNLCLSNSKGGELLIWNIDPDIKIKKELGVEDSGYPYPIELLNDIEHTSITINTGDLYFINANLIHAVKEIQGNERISLGRFMGFCSEEKIVYWT